MVSELEYKVAKVAYGEVEGTIYCMQKMDATPEDFDYVFFNNEHDVFRKAAGDPAAPFQFQNPEDEMGVDPNRTQIGPNQIVPGSLGSTQALTAAQRHAAMSQWPYEPTRSLADRQGGYKGPEGQTLAPRWRDRATDWMGRAKTGFGVPAKATQKVREEMRGLEEWRTDVKQNREDRQMMEEALKNASPEQRAAMIQYLVAKPETISGETKEREGPDDQVDPTDVVPEEGEIAEREISPVGGVAEAGPKIGEKKPDIDQEVLDRVTRDEAQAGEDALWQHHRGLANPLTYDKSEFETGGSLAGAQFHRSPAYGYVFGPEHERQGQVAGFGEGGMPYSYGTSPGQSNKRQRMARVVARGQSSGMIDSTTGKPPKGISNLVGLSPAAQMSQIIATQPENADLFDKVREAGHLGPFYEAYDAAMKKVQNHPDKDISRLATHARVSPHSVMQLFVGGGPGRWGEGREEGRGKGYAATMYPGVEPSHREAMLALSDRFKEEGKWWDKLQEPVAEQPDDIEDEGEIDASTSDAPRTSDAESKDVEIGLGTENNENARGREILPTRDKKSSDPLNSAWDHLTLLKEGDE